MQNAAKPSSRPSKTIVIVDDDEDFLWCLREILTRQRYDVFATLSPMEALKITTENCDVGLIISDLEMEEIRGDKLLEKVKKVKPEVVCLLISSHKVENDTIESQWIDLFVEKACCIERLLEILPYFRRSVTSNSFVTR